MNKWTRRTLLVGGALVVLPAVGLGGVKLWCIGNSLPRTQVPEISLLTTLYPDTAAAGKLGKKYLQQTASSAAAALRRLQQHKWLASAAESGCAVKIMLAVEQACRDDFRTGRVYCIDGWVLARTELDIAALCTTA